MNIDTAAPLTSTVQSNRTYRIAVGALFFLQGLCFATWASRIPSIQQTLGVSEAALGGLLLSLTVGSLLSLLFSGAAISRWGSRRVIQIILIIYPLCLVLIGSSTTVPTLATALVLFGAAGNLSNIAINTQAVAVEKMYGRSIMASFHGLWSAAGFVAAGIGTYAMGQQVTTLFHFVVMAGCIVAAALISFQFLVRDSGTTTNEKSKLFALPPRSLVPLGVLAFCCMICEGAMFDWSGIYFKKVVEAPQAWTGAGYTAFMCTMAGGRFLADWVTNHLSFKRTLTISGLLIGSGLLIAVCFPLLWPAIIGFALVGFGVSSVVPLVYGQAGRSKEVAPSVALTAVSSIGFFGFLVGPPVIGGIAGLSSLRLSFVLIAIMGLTITVIAQRLPMPGKNLSTP